MHRKILLTSFQTWLPHQTSNSSDDLLEKIAQLDGLPASLTFLRQLPVDVSKASRCAIAKIEELQPDCIICCGMAESRSTLTVESCATRRDALFLIRLYRYCITFAQRLRVKKLQDFLSILFGISHGQNSILIKTSVNLDTLLEKTLATQISHDAGKFVCEGLYYEILNHLRQSNCNSPCIFVHVPLLTPNNSHSIVADFQRIVETIVTLADHS